MKAGDSADRSAKHAAEGNEQEDFLGILRGKGLSLSRLRGEQRFLEYLRQLRLFSKRYTVLMAACDTPYGPTFGMDLTAEWLSLGLKENLQGKTRHGYAAIIDAGEVAFERLSPTSFEWVEHACMVEDTRFELTSVGFNAPRENAALILINGVNHSPCRRGLNFVVYDRVAGHVLDAVNFDVYAAGFPCYRPAALTEGLKAFAAAHPGVSVLCFNTPAFPKENLSLNERFILENAVGRTTILNNLDKPIFALNKYFDSSEDILEVLSAPASYHDVGGVRRFADVSGRCVNTAGGHRVTQEQPQPYRRTVFIIGGCRVFGVGSADGGTIASHLQKLFNTYEPGRQIKVENYGYYLAELSDASTGEELAILNALPVADGDIVLCDFTMPEGFAGVDMAACASRPHPFGEVFFDTQHYTADGNRLIAQKLFEKMEQLDFFELRPAAMGGGVKGKAQDVDYPLDMESKRELVEYKRILKEFYDSMFGVTIGAIVVNCNPFTLGHRYLVETAAKNCDHLIIFVVQEDQSIFPFDDRLRLVDEGTADLKNVTVIPSGRFIISSLTFSEYFNKAELQDRAVDSSMDVTLFAREIAPCLHISVRFVGEEPFDKVTRQYNDAMRAILPRHGIAFVEIPRKEWDGKPISASRVRTLLEERNFDQIAKIVPPATLAYLKERF